MSLLSTSAVSRMMLSTSKSVLQKHSQNKLILPSQQQAAMNMTTLSKKSAEEYKQQNYYARQAKTGRPISPHISMYKFPIVVFSSGINRFTGMFMTLGAGGLAGLELLGGPGTALSLTETIGSQHFAIASFFKFGVSFHILYHYAGGIRHLVWDNKPELLNNEQVEQSAYYLMGGVTLGSIAMAFI